jgi:Ice-binding-like
VEIKPINKRNKNILKKTAKNQVSKNAKRTCLVILGIAFAAIFTSHDAIAAGRLPVNLGDAGDYTILAKSGISTVPTSVITGNIGVSPIGATAITGFALKLTFGASFSTSAQVIGRVYAPGYAAPTPANLTTAVGDMQTAYTDAAGRVTPDFTELGSGQIGGRTLVPGLYKWSTGVLISTDVTLSGDSNAVWIFQIAKGITQANAKHVILAGGAQAKNIFWQSFGSVSIGTGSHFEGIILSHTSISMGAGASINGRLLAQTAVTLNSSTVKAPAAAVPAGFFTGQDFVAPGVEYLQFPDGVVFGFYDITDFKFPIFYHYDMGFEYFYDAGNTEHGAYLYDFSSSTFFYTDPATFPYLYDFKLNAWLYYYPDTQRAGHYTSKPRYFYNFATSQTITK